MNAHLVLEDGRRIPAKVDLSSISIDYGASDGDQSVIGQWNGMELSGTIYRPISSRRARRFTRRWILLVRTDAIRAGYRVVNHRGRNKLEPLR